MTDEQRQLMAIEGECAIDMFHKSEIRKVFHEGEWWFSVKDVLEALFDTPDGNRYSRDLRTKDDGLKSTWAEITRTLPFNSGTRGMQETTFINIEGIFRMMQAVPSKKAEPFKKWLAKVGYERVQEVQNPEIALRRAILLYRAKGYDDGWIDARIQNKASREALEVEWDKRGIKDPIHFAILTDAISVETFDISTKQHKTVKGLKGQSLRDNMTPIELTLTTLGEQAAKAITQAKDARSLNENINAAQSGGRIAGQARKQIEEATGEKVVSPMNYLTPRQRENNAKELPSGFDNVLQQLIQTPPISNEEIENQRKAA